MTRRLTMAESVLRDLGIAEPEDIDVEAIAWHLGAKVRYRELYSCEARIVGRGDRAIITVDDRIPQTRRKFSVAHELGHWRHHRGRCLVCRSDEIGDRRRSATDPERVADGFASDLLLPRYVLDPLLRKMKRPDLVAVRQLAARFGTSLTATTIKMMEADRFAMMLICHGEGGRRWFDASPSIDQRKWFPKTELDPESCAFAMFYGHAAEERFPRKIGADAWFERGDAGAFEVSEQSFGLPNREVATILVFTDDEMI